MRRLAALAVACLMSGCGGGRPQGGTTATPADSVAPAPVDTARPVPVEGDSMGVDAAADAVRAYYAAIEARDYPAAYRRWGDEGRSSGQTPGAFARGFANTAHVTVDVGTPGPMEGAAGSRYVEIPVTVRATTRDGRAQKFEGHYVLRRVAVDGATPAQRRWHLDSAQLRRVD